MELLLALTLLTFGSTAAAASAVFEGFLEKPPDRVCPSEAVDISVACGVDRVLHFELENNGKVLDCTCPTLSGVTICDQRSCAEITKIVTEKYDSVSFHPLKTPTVVTHRGSYNIPLLHTCRGSRKDGGANVYVEGMSSRHCKVTYSTVSRSISYECSEFDEPDEPNYTVSGKYLNNIFIRGITVGRSSLRLTSRCCNESRGNLCIDPVEFPEISVRTVQLPSVGNLLLGLVNGSLILSWDYDGDYDGFLFSSTIDPKNLFTLDKTTSLAIPDQACSFHVSPYFSSHNGNNCVGHPASIDFRPLSRSSILKVFQFVQGSANQLYVNWVPGTDQDNISHSLELRQKDKLKIYYLDPQETNIVLSTPSFFSGNPFNMTIVDKAEGMIEGASVFYYPEFKKTTVALDMVIALPVFNCSMDNGFTLNLYFNTTHYENITTLNEESVKVFNMTGEEGVFVNLLNPEHCSMTLCDSDQLDQDISFCHQLFFGNYTLCTQGVVINRINNSSKECNLSYILTGPPEEPEPSWQARFNNSSDEYNLSYVLTGPPEEPDSPWQARHDDDIDDTSGSSATTSYQGGSVIMLLFLNFYMFNYLEQ